VSPSQFASRLAAAVGLSAWFIFVYNGCNYLASRRSDVGIAPMFWWEAYFPFVPWLIIPYWSIDLLFFLAPFFIKEAFLLKQHCKRIAFGIAVAGVFFLLYPLKLGIQRPEVHGTLGQLFGSLENFNNFYNCAPSLHIVLRTNLWAIYVTPSRTTRPLKALWFALIGISTLLCWQHHVVDVITGQLLGLTCLWLFPSVPFTTTRSNTRKDLARRYAAGAALCYLAAYHGWPHLIVFLWPALALSIVALAYAAGQPTLFRKYQGRLLAGTRWLLNPYRWAALASRVYFNKDLPAYAEIVPGLYVGRMLSEKEAREINSPAVLDLTAEYDETPELLKRTYLNVPMLDLTPPTEEQLQLTTEFIRQHPEVYIHCSLGLGRSVAVARAYLLAAGFTPAEAEAALRPRTSLLASFAKTD
jgi:membrane-associated phospholipid phosphatase